MSYVHLIAILTILTEALAVVAGAAEPQAAVKEFLKTSYSFERKVDRKYALTQIEDVTAELGVDRLSSERVLSFPTWAGAPIVHKLVAVNKQGVVRLLDSRESINQLFDSVPTNLESSEFAQLLIDTFLRVRAFSNFRNYGYPLGHNIIRERDDIPGLGIVDRTLVDMIQPPKLEKIDEKYSFTFYSWSEIGGALSRHTLFVSGDRIIEYKIEILRQWIGKHGLYK